MSITFKTAVRENVGLLIGLAGGTGSGKTFSAFRLASGISGGKPFAVIDTEARRALHYADQFKFDHAELHAPFRPDAYAEAIKAADAAGYPVIVVDSVSHVWAGDGGVLDWQEEEFERLGSKDSMKILSWSKPKQAHKKFVQSLLQCRAHLILCFRAEEKIEMVRDPETKKMSIVPKHSLTGSDGWIPVCEKTLPFELTVSFLMTASKPGIPQPIKLQEQHRALFPLDKPITEESGRLVAEWAAGGSKPPASVVMTNGEGGSHVGKATAGAGSGFAELINADQQIHIADLLAARTDLKRELLDALKINSLSEIPASKYAKVVSNINKALEGE